jgi:hypothetical protein
VRVNYPTANLYEVLSSRGVHAQLIGDESVAAELDVKHAIREGTEMASSICQLIGSKGMGLIHIEMFATLDLVAQAPGGPDEDPIGFPFGGWQAPLVEEVSGAQVGAAYEGTDALLLGRRTYDIFAAFWPHQEGGPGRRHRDALQQRSEVRGLPRQARPLVGRVHTARP